MKVALLVSGEFREFAIAHKFWSFLQIENVDVYFSLWSVSNIVHSIKNQPNLESINYKLINSLNPVGTCVEFPRPDIVHNAQKMIHRLKKGFELILNSGKNYDVIMTVRPDIITYAPVSLFREELKRAYEEQKCLIDCYSGLDGSGDAIIMYPTKYAKEFVEYDFNAHFVYSSEENFPQGDIHKIFGYFFHGKAGSIKTFVNKHTIVRPNARNLSPLHQRSFRQIAFKTAEWWSNNHKSKPCMPNLNDPDCT